MKPIFLAIFLTVITVVATTVLCALWRAHRRLRREPVEALQWHADFEELPAADRTCRHVLTGEFKDRKCPHAFDCRECTTHARLIEKCAQPMPAEREPEILGMPYPLDRLYHRGHTWAHLEQDGTMIVGLDELGRRLLGDPVSFVLPDPGTPLRANGPAFRVRRNGSEVRVLSPVDGKVIETGDPAKGWLLRIRPEPLDVTHLLRGAEIRPWVLREMERLQLAFSSQDGAPALADGGVLMENIPAACPNLDWDAISGEMFLEP
jgi:glycine cleavage system H lipoate-binding protein